MLALPVDSKVPIYILVLWQPLQLVLLKAGDDTCLTTVTTNSNKRLVKCHMQIITKALSTVCIRSIGNPRNIAIM